MAHNTWISEGWGHLTQSPDELMRAVGRIGTLHANRRFVWRGVKDWRWPIQSSLQRFIQDQGLELDHRNERDVRAAEKTILAASRRWKLDDGGSFSDQAMLALLQHHGSPTRFIDVTSDPMTALWFACEPAWGLRDSRGALFAFDVTDFDSLKTGIQAVNTWASLGSGQSGPYESALEKSAETGRPMLVDPSQRDARMSSQQGLFICGAVSETNETFGVDAFTLTAVPPGSERLEALFAVEERRPGRPVRVPFVALVIPPSVKRKMRLHLKGTYNKDVSTLFPDFAGLAMAIQSGKELVRDSVQEALVAPDEPH